MGWTVFVGRGRIRDWMDPIPYLTQVVKTWVGTGTYSWVMEQLLE